MLEVVEVGFRFILSLLSLTECHVQVSTDYFPKSSENVLVHKEGWNTTCIFWLPVSSVKNYFTWFLTRSFLVDHKAFSWKIYIHLHSWSLSTKTQFEHTVWTPCCCICVWNDPEISWLNAALNMLLWRTSEIILRSYLKIVQHNCKIINKYSRSQLN